MAPSKYKIHDPFEGWLFERLFKKCSKYSCWGKYKEFERNIFFICLSANAETDQIWKTYTPHGLGVCIKLDISKLKDKFSDDNFILGSVKYKTIGTIQKELIDRYLALENPTEEQIIDLFFWKMKGFKTDNEIRLSIIVGDKDKDDIVYERTSRSN